MQDFKRKIIKPPSFGGKQRVVSSKFGAEFLFQHWKGADGRITHKHCTGSHDNVRRMDIKDK